MHKVSVIVVLTACLLGRASAEDAAVPGAAPAGATPSPAAAASADARMQVYGDFPASVAGTWLVVTNTFGGKERGKDLYINSVHIYRFSVHDHQWRLQELDRGEALPALSESSLVANKAATKLELNAESIKAVAAVVPKLHAIPDAEAFTRVEMRTADHFETAPGAPAYKREARFSIEILERKHEDQASSGFGFYAKDVAPNLISGGCETAIVALGPGTVVPFAAPGVFTMYRLQ